MAKTLKEISDEADMMISRTADPSLANLDPAVQRVLEDESRNPDGCGGSELSLRKLGPEKVADSLVSKYCPRCHEPLSRESLRFGLCLCGHTFKGSNE